jgi:hypothetical protein
MTRRNCQQHARRAIKLPPRTLSPYLFPILIPVLQTWVFGTTQANAEAATAEGARSVIQVDTGQVSARQ